MKRWQILMNLTLEIIEMLGIGIFLVFALPKLLQFFWPFVMGWILSLLAIPICLYLERRFQMNQRWGLAVVIFLVIAVLSGLLYFVIVQLGRECLVLLSDAPDYYEELKDFVRYVGDSLRNMLEPVNPTVAGQIAEVTENSTLQIDDFFLRIFSESLLVIRWVAMNLTDWAIGFMIVFLSAYLFTKDREQIMINISTLLSDEMGQLILNIKSEVVGAIGGFLIAQLKIMGIIFLILLIGFLSMRNPLAFLLALVIAIVDIFPVLGTGTILIPWMLLSLMRQNYGEVIGLTVIQLVVVVTRQVIQPRILGDSMGIGSLLSLFLIYVGFKLYGIYGMIFALLGGSVCIRLYRAGLFDRKINRWNRLLYQYQCEKNRD